MKFRVQLGFGKELCKIGECYPGHAALLVRL
jgi:hypothetical protein